MNLTLSFETKRRALKRERATLFAGVSVYFCWAKEKELLPDLPHELKPCLILLFRGRLDTSNRAQIKTRARFLVALAHHLLLRCLCSYCKGTGPRCLHFCSQRTGGIHIRRIIALFSEPCVTLLTKITYF